MMSKLHFLFISCRGTFLTSPRHRFYCTTLYSLMMPGASLSEFQMMSEASFGHNDNKYSENA